MYKPSGILDHGVPDGETSLGINGHGRECVIHESFVGFQVVVSNFSVTSDLQKDKAN